MRPTFLLLTVLTTTAGAAPLGGVRGHLGVAASLSSPQAEAFGGGADVSATPFLQLLPALDVYATVGLVVLAASPARVDARAGGLVALLAGARLKAPMKDALVSPWVELSVGPGYSGPAHLVVSGATGVSLRAVASWPVWLGVSVRGQYLTRAAEVPGFQSLDLALLSVGASLEFLPGSVETDHDRDGVPDESDVCPTEFAETADGCPAPLVAEEAPPAAPGPPVAECDGHVDDGGRCVPHVRVTPERLELDEKILFAYGTTQILPRSESLLEAVARTLAERPALFIRIEGHADAKGTASFNLQLSEARARAVRDFLVQQGIDGRRLSTRGYGAQLPRDDNRSADGRDHNRRVEFVIVEEGAP